MNVPISDLQMLCGLDYISIRMIEKRQKDQIVVDLGSESEKKYLYKINVKKIYVRYVTKVIYSLVSQNKQHWHCEQKQ